MKAMELWGIRVWAASRWLWKKWEANGWNQGLGTDLAQRETAAEIGRLAEAKHVEW